jgi:hypothetical protein
MIAQINGVDMMINGIDDNADYIDRLRRTLALCPAQHLAYIHHVTVRDRRDYEGGSTNWVSRRDHTAGLWIMIDIDSFNPRLREINNRPPNFFHYTILHELGHVVDLSYRSLRYIRRHDTPGYRVITQRAHRGITQGPGEHFADVYADYFFYSEQEMPTDARMQAMLQSPAFNGITAPRR